MQKIIKYVIFKTKWGHFGLAGIESALWRTQLPQPQPEKIKSRLLKNLPDAQFDENYFKTLQQQIISYFEGTCVDFNLDVPIDFNGSGGFSRKVLAACRNIKFGRRITYSGLAKKAGRPAASRAVGNALAKNPLPLIIPCHRVLRSDGKMGGFSAPGGISLKKRMLALERQAVEV
jgi:methylated-DNA-[protein]-cysteine S-methyltransferase